MNNKKLKIFLISLLIFITGFFIFYNKNIPSPSSISKTTPPPQTSVAILNKEISPETKPACTQLRSKFLHLDELMKSEKLEVRFQNIHKRIGNQIFRLRRFFREGNEAEIESFLVYLEDANESAKIIEKSLHQKGRMYLKIESDPGEILYREVGVNLENKQQGNLFLHYINNELKGAQGEFTQSDKTENIDCRF